MLQSTGVTESDQSRILVGFVGGAGVVDVL